MQKARAIGRRIRIAIIDDHDIVRRGVGTILNGVAGIEVVGSAGDLAGALGIQQRLRPDVVLVDITMPGTSGMEVVRELRRHDPQARYLVLTGMRDEGLICEVLAAGAVGAVSKSDPTEKLIAAIYRASSGAPLYDEATLARARTKGRESQELRDSISNLTHREHAVVDLVALGLTNAEIADELHLAEKTVRNYVSNVLAKVGLSNRTQLATQVTRIASLGLSPVGAR